MTFENGPVANDESSGIHVTDNRPWRMNLQLFFGLNLGYDLALDEHRNGANFPLHRCLSTDHYTGVRDNLPFNFAFDPPWPLKLYFSITLYSPSNICF